MLEVDLKKIAPDLKKVLLIGHEGTGKTRFLGTMPRPMYHFSLDKGFYTLAGEDGITSCIILERDRCKPVAFKEFLTQYDKVISGQMKYKYEDGREEPYKTIAIDSLTALSTMIFDHYQYVNSNVDKKASFTEYQLVKSLTEDILNKAKRTSHYIGCTALIKADKDELTGEIFYLSNMIGSIRDDVGSYFDAVFYMQPDKRSDGTVIWQMHTVGNRRQKAKVRVPSRLKAGIAPVEVPDFRVITQKLTKAKEEQNAKNPSKP